MPYSYEFLKNFYVLVSKSQFLNKNVIEAYLVIFNRFKSRNGWLRVSFRCSCEKLKWNVWYIGPANWVWFVEVFYKNMKIKSILNYLEILTTAQRRCKKIITAQCRYEKIITAWCRYEKFTTASWFLQRNGIKTSFLWKMVILNKNGTLLVPKWSPSNSTHPRFIRKLIFYC